MVWKRAFLLLAAVCLLASGVGAVDDEGYRIHVRDDVLRRGNNPFRFRAIEVPELTRPGMTPGSITTAYNRAADVGANAVAFTVFGLSDDGTALSGEGEKAARDMAQAARARYMTAVCRILAASAPRAPSYRSAAVRSVAAALKDEYRMLYWIEGPDSPALAQEFKKAAPDLAVAAFEGGDVRVIKPSDARPEGEPYLLVTGLEENEPGPSLSSGPGAAGFIFFADPDPYPFLDRTSRDPIEDEPWTPDNSVLTDEEREDGWIALFNGRNLSGWMVTGDRRGFQVRDGMIEWAKKGGGTVRTRNRYDNFILRLEWKIGEDGNSGIFLRAPRVGRSSRIGMEFQLRGDFGKPPTPDSTGAIYAVLAPRVNTSRPAGEWNQVEITLDGSRLRAVLNEQTVHDLDIGDHPELRYRLRRGFIGLQDHGNYVAFRNIRLKPLPTGRP